MFHLKDIAVVILNWNGKGLLNTFLPSVIKHSKDAKIYVVDNASTDDSVAFLETHFQQVKVIKNTVNGGYAKGYNDAITHIKEPLLCLLNSDIEVTEHWLNPILDQFNSDSETVIIQPKILDYKKKTHFEYAGAAGGFIDKYAFPYCRGRIFNTIEEDTNQYNDTSTIFWASGACFFIRKSTFQELNGFDASFFAHMEEIDLCWRAYNLGYKAKYIGNSTVYHVGGATLNTTNPKKTYLNFRNSLYTLTKNTDKNLFARVFLRMVLDGIAGIRFIFQLQLLHCFSILKAHFSFYNALPRLLKQRKQLKKRSNYYNCNSIVWSYFIKKNKTF
ncbi:glycosyltransferase family 2 protein [Winogradskyella immobilis]|uniref:Glycosyltransferase family 2 protein n=1 Tax=Winogradskyella immobilis TaxID=2816852 RepID=A0ABS8EL13_9FLAO|nr:glycosyltransferase family 2 protein [Winogradskyella immobilis]MCC1483707.1 glycosyltransferase family 2 protein [Winogradskyella immobilis]MCG0015801.1 glycosyltransferase family 2 protein [Winogradskyella immobilis]